MKHTKWKILGIERYSSKNLNGSVGYGCIFFNKIQLHREAPGLISEGPGWIVFHDGWMYGPYDFWYEPILAFIFEYKNDKHLVG